MTKESQKTFEQNMEAMSKMSYICWNRGEETYVLRNREKHNNQFFFKNQFG